MKSLLSIFLLLVFLHSLGAAEITGIVQSGSNKNATVRVEGELVPVPGDKAEIFFKLAGAEDEISVASASVTKVEGGSVELKIAAASGEIAKDQLVRIISANPQKIGATPGSPTAAATPATRAAETQPGQRRAIKILQWLMPGARSS